MAFNIPQFNNPLTGSPITPLLVTTKFSPFLQNRNLANQLERNLSKSGKKMENAGFVDPSFEAMMKAVGWQGSQAWCAYYIKLVLMQMFSFDREWLSKTLTGSSFGNFYAVQNKNKAGDNRYVAYTDDSWQIGDVFCLKNISGSGGHTGMILEVLSDGKIKTIEGNTNLGGAREGDRVLSITRTLKVGGNSGGQKVIGGFRRNFTEKELNALQFDEANQTFILSSTILPTKLGGY
jgi:hypothetical protein